ncbi:hypothetical protein [Modestobacter sp. VKM Ac-2984]|nr:hypothetical protein [Modestobacter sp. VKM Ac-2984]MCZ2816161.1 hypothetical protein [Modestobacter sp. VKM Ac-2984]
MTGDAGAMRATGSGMGVRVDVPFADAVERTRAAQARDRLRAALHTVAAG